jgi:putative transposase
VVKVTGGSNKRVSLAVLIAIKPGCRPRLIYRAHKTRHCGKDQRKGFTERDYAQLLDAAHQQLAGPFVVVWDNLNAHVSAAMADLVAARNWLTIYQLPAVCARTQPRRAGLVTPQALPGRPGQTQPRRTDRPGEDPAETHAIPCRPP